MSLRPLIPLDDEAARAADASFAQEYPEMAGTPAMLMRDDAHWEAWVRHYAAAGGPVEETGPAAPPQRPAQPCQAGSTEQLVSLTVISGATRENVRLPKHWATVKRAGEHVLIQAETCLNTPQVWARIRWQGGQPVQGQPNQRRVSRATSAKTRVQATLGSTRDEVTVWVLWATIRVLTSGNRPAGAAPFGQQVDGNERLGEARFQGLLEDYDPDTDTSRGHFQSGAGKVAIVATITPPGVHEAIGDGWALKRECFTHEWGNAQKMRPGNSRGDLWNTAWVDDTSLASNLRLVPDAQDAIYDIDGPNIRAGLAPNTYERYMNFRQWVEWRGERCSDYGLWYWRARWDARLTPRNVVLNDLGTGNRQLPDTPYFTARPTD